MSLSHSKSTDVSNSEGLIIELIPLLKNALFQSFRLYGRQPSQDEVEEHSQEIVLLLIEDDFRRLRLFDQRSSLRTWIGVVAKHYLSNYFRGLKTIESLSDISPDFFTLQPAQEKDVVFREMREKLRTIRKRLTKTDQLLLTLLRSDLSTEKIAMKMKIKSESVRRRKYGLIKKMQMLLKEEGFQRERKKQKENFQRV
jgi:RNA polymerase sigma factor (sigma-70 family)